MFYKKIMPVLLSGTMFFSALPCESVFADAAAEVDTPAEDETSVEMYSSEEDDTVAEAMETSETQRSCKHEGYETYRKGMYPILERFGLSESDADDFASVRKTFAVIGKINDIRTGKGLDELKISFAATAQAEKEVSVDRINMDTVCSADASALGVAYDKGYSVVVLDDVESEDILMSEKEYEEYIVEYIDTLVSVSGSTKLYSGDIACADCGENMEAGEDIDVSVVFDEPDHSADSSEQETVVSKGNADETESDEQASKEEKQDVITISGSKGVRTITLSDPSKEYTDMRFAVWSEENGQDDCTWHALQKQSDGSWKVDFYADSLKHSGTAIFHFYTEKATFIGAAQDIFADDEVVAETVTVTGTGSKRNVSIRTSGTYSSMRVAVWSSEGGQDDLKWYAMTKQSDGTWKVSVDLHSLKHGGTANFHVYGTAKSSVLVNTASAEFSDYDVLGYSISAEKNGSKEHVEVKTAASYKNMKAAVWSATGGQDDLKWYTLTKQSDGTWVFDLPYSDLKHDGTVYIHVYTGTSTFVGGKTISVKKEVPKLETVSVSDTGEKRAVSVTTNDVDCDSMRIAVWSSEGGQDDLKWYTMQRLATEHYSWDGTIPVANIKHSGTVMLHVYVNGNTFIGSSTFALKEEDMVRDRVEISEEGGMRTITVTPVNSYSGMSVAVWSHEGGQDDLKWIDLKKQSDGTWSVTFYPGWLKHSGECIAHVYASGSKFIKALDITVDENEIRNSWVTVTGTGMTRKITAFSSKSNTNVRVAVWSHEGGQDDLKWTTMKKNSDGTWSTTISTADLKHYGECFAHVYAGTSTLVGTAEFEIARNEMPKNAFSVNGTGAYKTFTLNNTSSSFNSVKVAVWSMTAGQDDLTWKDLKKGTDGVWSLQYPVSSLKHSGTCYAHVYVDDVLVAAKTFDVSDADYFKGLLTYKQPYDPFGKGYNIDFVRCAINIAYNNSIGYGHTWPATISCAGLVGLSLTYCGYGDFIKNDPLHWGYIDLGPEYEAELINKVGCQVLQGPWNRSNYTQLLPGDIVYYYYNNSYNHAGIYIGNGYLVEARGAAGATDRDDSGAEVGVYYWPNDGIQFQKVFRIPASKLHYVS